MIPMVVSILRSILWLTVSKAADRSSRMRTEDSPCVLAVFRASVTESKAVSVECPLLNPDCFGSSSPFWFRKLVTCFATVLSRVLDRKGSSETGL